MSQKDDGAVLLVDVGGARGHEIEAIKKRYPNLPGRFLIQDLPNTIEQALQVPGMEAVVHDSSLDSRSKVSGGSNDPQTVILTHQPGARVYYFRSILQDWLDDKCKLILAHLASAMKPGYSKILLNELILPD